MKGAGIGVPRIGVLRFELAALECSFGGTALNTDLCLVHQLC